MGMGLIISAPNSGSGKTIITLGILRSLKNRSVNIRAAKSGPDYIDPRFHSMASGSECYNLDSWAMSKDRLRSISSHDGHLIIEGAMGLFDGAPPFGKGSTAHLAKILNLPIILIMDCSKISQSIAAVAEGFINFDEKVKIDGVILNKIGSTKHEKILTTALFKKNIPVIGCVHRDAQLLLPSRHLGLIQAQEKSNINEFIEYTANVIEKSIDINTLINLFKNLPQSQLSSTMEPPAQRISIASDGAFSFAYPHILDDWHKNGAEISTFSPLENQAPHSCDLVFLPGGYPELYAPVLANADRFKKALRSAKKVYGECGGYMTMGNTLIDENGTPHKMLGLLDLETSFENKKLHLGYRTINGQNGCFVGSYSAHEFHYATTISAKGKTLFSVRDAENNKLPDSGLINETSSGSFLHIIDKRL